MHDHISDQPADPLNARKDDATRDSDVGAPWWVLPSGRIHPIWWLAVLPVLIWIEYAAGPENQLPALYVIPVCIAAWYSGPWTALSLAVAAPIVHMTFDLAVWHSPSVVPGLVTGIVRTVVVAFIALVFSRQSDHERERRRELERRHADQMRAEQLRVVQVTMRTVQDIVNNCLNQLQLLRLDAEGHVSEESLQMYDRAIRDASVQLKALADLEVFKEKQMEMGTGVDVGSSPE